MKTVSFAALSGAGLLFSSLALGQPEPAPSLFVTADRCIACHSGLNAASGEDVSIGYDWRASMMANAGRDPYWLASVRREISDHPQAQEAIEDKCSICHLPMARFTRKTTGGSGTILEHQAVEPTDPALTALARDGVSCSLCHQVLPDGLGDEGSFTGGFEIDTTQAAGEREIFGPHEVDAGRSRIMQSASSFSPAVSGHTGSSELCGSCHTVFTHAMDDRGRVVGELAEQVPYLEWLHSDYREERSCPDCHMPALEEPAAISSVLGEPRPNFSQHVFRGGNAFMLRLLNAHRGELGVEALPQELSATAERTEAYLQAAAAGIDIEALERKGDTLEIGVRVENLAGHKLPTAYPSRRAWLYLAVHNGSGRLLFESGAMHEDGSIAGHDGDSDATAFEPHHDVIDSPDQVQAYEPVMADWKGRPTTGLLYGVRYLKDNRLLPAGFDKQSASPHVAVLGAAADDPDFTAGGDHVRYRVGVEGASGPLTVTAELRYQTIGYRWARNLEDYPAAETERFLEMFDPLATTSMVRLARDTETWGDDASAGNSVGGR